MMHELKNPSTRQARIASRLYGLFTCLTPEDLNIFLRNSVVSHKMLAYSQRIKNENGYQPNIAFNYHGGHSGIEDFLQLGPKFAKMAIDLFPRKILRKLVEFSGRLDNFCAIKEIKLPKDLQQITQADGSEEFRFATSFSERIFLDEELKAILQEKLKIHD